MNIVIRTLELQRQLGKVLMTVPLFRSLFPRVMPVRAAAPRRAMQPRGVSRPYRVLLLPLLFLAAASPLLAQTTNDFRSRQNGNWNSTNTWERWNGTTWINATATPSSGNNVITVLTNHTVTVTSGVTVDQVTIDAGGQITINSGITLTINDGTGTDMTINGTVNNLGTFVGTGGPSVTVNGTFINGGTISSLTSLAFNSGSLYQHNLNAGTIPTATWNTTSTCEIIGSTTTVPGGLSQTFANFRWNCTNQTANITLGGAPTTISGNFIVANTGSAQLVGISGTSGWAPTISGDFIVSGGFFNYSSGSSGTLTLNLDGSFTQTGGTFTNGNSASTLNLNFTGTGSFTQSGGTFGNARISYTVASGAVLALSNNVSVATSRSFTVGGTLNCGSSIVSGAGTFTLSSGGTLGIGDANGISSSGATGNIQTTTRSYSTSANYTYNGSAAQVTGSMPTTVNDFTVANLGGVVTLSTNVTVNNNLTINTGAELNGGSATITLPISGTTLIVNGTFTPSTSTVVYTSTSGANVTGGISYYNLTLNHSGDTFTAANNLTVQNVLTIASGTTFNASSRTITLSGSGTPLVVTGSLTPSTSTIAYTSGSGATVAGTTYNNLTINGTGTFALGAPATVNTTLTLSNGILATGANLLSLASTANTAVSGASASSYVFGTVQKTFGTTGNPQSFSFPIGDASNYMPLSLTAMTVTSGGSLTASTTASEQPNIATSDLDSTMSVNRYWTLARSGIVTSAGNVTFNYLSGDVDGSATPAQFAVRRFASSAWNNATVSGTPTTTNTTISNPISSSTGFGDFAIGNAKIAQTITFPSPGNQIYGVAPITLGATASSGFAVSYVVTSGPGTISSGVLTVTSNGSITITASQAGDVHYTAASNVSQTISIAQKALTVNGVTASNKVYNGNATATVVTNGATLVGVVGSDVVTLTGTAAGVFSDKNIGTNKNVTVSGLTLGGSSAAKYTLTQPTATANISAVNLTVSATGSNRVYNGTTTATVTLSDNRVGGDSITDSYATASFADKNFGTAKSVSVTGISISGTDSGNYILANTNASTTANITRATLTVSATATNKVYDRTTAASVSLSDNRISGDLLTNSFTSATFATATVGNGKTVTVSGIAISGTDANNYTLSSTTATTAANITQAPLTVSGITANNKVYNRTNTATLSGTAALVGVFAGDTVNIGGTPAATFSDKNVGTNKTVSITGYTISGTPATNYSLTQPSLTANITSAGLTVNGVTANSKPYDGNTVATLNTGSANFVGVFSGDVVSVNVSGATGAFNNKNIGTAKPVTVSGIAATGGDSGNYIVTQPASSANITAAALIPAITASDKVYDRTNTATITSRTLTGVVSPDVVNLIGGSATFSDRNVGNAKNVVATGFSLTGIDATNYSLSTTSATNTASITAATVTGSITASDKVYDGTTTAAIATRSLTNVFSPDVVSLVGGSALFDDKNVGIGKTVTATNLALSGADSGNYLLASDGATATASITTKALTVGGVTSSKVYDGNTNAPLNFGGATFSGLVGGDDVTFDGSGATGSFANKTVASGKPVTISGVTASGADLANYSFTQPVGVGEITARTLALSFTGVNKVYDATTVATVNFTDDRIGVDALSATYSAAFEDKSVGTVKTINVTGISVSGLDSGNYSLPSTTGSTVADITSASLTIVANNASRIVGANNPVLTGTITGVQGSDNITASYTTAATNDSPAGNYPIIAAAVDPDTNLGNYSLVTSNAILSVNALASQWSTNDGGNGHYFQPILAPQGITWDDAQNAAAARGGYLATVTSTAENTFVFGAISGISDLWLANNSGGDGPWIGGTVGAGPADATNWTWISSEPFAFNNWESGQPDNDGGNQNHVQFFSASALTGATWNDLANADIQHVRGYVIEFDNDPNRADQTITFNTLAAKTYGDAPFTVSATASSSLPVTFSIVSGPATISGDTITLTGVGTVTVRASQAGDVNYNSAADVDRSFLVNPKSLTMTISAANRPYDTTAAASITSRVLNGVVGSDDVSPVGGTASFDDKNVGAGKTVTETGLSISGANVANYLLASTTATTTADISAISVNITGVAANNKVYNGNTVASLAGSPVLLGILGSDDVSVAGIPSATFADKNVADNIAVTVTGFTIAGGDAGNYLVSQPAGLSANITTASLTVVGVTANSKVYDATALATLSGTASLSGIIGTDDVTVVGTPSAAFGDKIVQNNKSVTVLGYTISGADAGNYALNQPVGLTANITHASLSVSGITADNKTYDGTVSATIHTGSAALVGVIGSDVVSLDVSVATGSFGDKLVAVGKTVTVAGLTLTGDDSANYVIALTTTTADITSAALNVVNVTANNKIYDGNNTASLNGTASLSGVVGTDDVSVAGTPLAVFADKIVADNKPVTVTGYTIGGTDAANYTVSQPSGLTANITPFTLTASITANGKTYNSSTAVPIASRSVTGVISPDEVSATGGSASFDNKNVGTDKTVTASGLTLSGVDAGNYVLSGDPVTTTANITAASVSASGITASNKIYDGDTTATLNTGSTSLVGTFGSDDLGLDASSASGLFADQNVGTNKTVSVTGLALNGADAVNYNLSPTAATADITLAAVTVTAVDVSRIIGATNPAFSATYTGFIAGEDASVLSGNPLFTTTADTNSIVGSYSIVPSVGSLTAANYGFAFVNGSLRVLPAEALFFDNFVRIANPGSIAPWTAQSGNWFTTNGTMRVGPDDFTSYGFAYIDTNWSNYSVEASVQMLASNGYGGGIGGRLNGTTGGHYAAWIYPEGSPVEESAGKLALVKFQDWNNWGYLGSALVPMQLVNLPGPVGTNAHLIKLKFTGNQITVSFDGTNVIDMADAEEQPFLSGGIVAGNWTQFDPYQISYDDVLVLAPPAQTITFDALAAKTYGDAPFAVSAIASSSLPVSFAIVSGPATISGNIVTITGAGTVTIRASQAGDANYSPATDVDRSFLVSPASLTVTADNNSRAYGSSNPALTGTLTGVVSGDDITVSYSTTAIASSPVGGYDITPVLADPDLRLGNYTVASTSGTLSVTAASLTVTADNQSRAYGSSNPVLTGTLTGVVNGDDITVSYSTAAVASSPVGGYDVTPVLADPDLRLGNYTVASTSGTLTVTAASLGVAADNKSRTYGSSNPALTGTLNGVVNGDDITVSYSTAAIGSSPVGGYDITPLLADPGLKLTNYTVANTSGTLTVTAANLSVAADNKSRTYGSSNPALTGTLTGVVNGDDITVSYTTAAIASSPVGGYDITPVLADPDLRLSNYAVVSSNGTLTVTAAALTGTVNSQSRSYGQVNPAFTVNYTGFVNLENAGIVTGSLSFSCVDTNSNAVDTNTPVGIYPVTVLSGQSAPNYQITYVPGTLAITPASLLVQADNKSRGYGDTNPVLTASFVGLMNGEDASVVTGSAALSTLADTNSPVGTYAIEVGQGTLSNANYDLSFSNGVLTVTVGTLNVAADNQSRVYGSSNPTLTGTLSGLLNGDNITVSYNTTAIASSPVGGYDITPVLADPDLKLTNYTVVSSNGTLTVTAASLTVTADNNSRTYGSSNPMLTGTLTGVVNGDDITATYSTAAIASSPVGGYDITPVLADPDLRLTNYTVTSSNGTLTVTPASLTVTADNNSRAYGSSNPALTGTLTGVVSGDDITVSYSTTAIASSPVGGYDITPVLADPDLRLGNYTVASTSGTLSVTAASLTVTADNQSRAYGSSNPVLTGTLTGVVNGDDITVSYSTAAVASSPVGGYDVTPVLADPDLRLGNYTVASTSGTLTVTAASLGVAADNKSRTYGSSNPALTGTLNGVVNGDDITVSYSTAAIGSSPVGGYDITPLLADPGLKLTNYTVANTSGTLTVTAANLSVAADNKSRTYGSSNPALTGTLTGVVNGDDITVSYTTAAIASSPVGGYDITPVLADPDLRLSNYAVVSSNGTLTVTAAALTGTVNSQSRSYGQVNPAFTVNYTGFVNLENAGIVTGSLSFSCVDTNSNAVDTNTPVGIYPVTVLSGQSAPNYQITYVPGTLAITPASLLVQADNKSRGYGDTNPVLTASFVGLMNGEDASVVTGSAALSTLADTNSPVGTYAIEVGQGTLSNANYDLSFSNGVLTVTVGTLNVAADNQSRVYGSSNPTLTGTLSGLLNGDNITVSYNTTAIASSPVGGYDITPVLADPDLKLTNYTVVSSNGTLTVTAASLTVTADNNSRTYGSSNPMLTGTLTGVVNGDDITATYSTAAIASSPVGGYDITPVLADPDLRLTNYTVTSSNGTLTVTAVGASVTWNTPSDIIYGTALSASQLNAVGSVAGTLTYTPAAGTVLNAGSGQLLSVTLTPDDTNYSSASTSVNINVLPAGSSIALASSTNSSLLPGVTVTFTATLSAMPPGNGVPTGTVQFNVDGSPVGAPRTLTSGIASFSTSSLSHGSHTVGASYNGDGNFMASSNSLANQIVNTPPVAGNYAISTTVGVPVNFAASKLAALVSDDDNDAISITSVSSTSTNGGTAALEGGMVTFTPLAASTSTDYFTYTADDGLGGTVTGTVAVTITTATASSNGPVGMLPNGHVLVKLTGAPGDSYMIQGSADLQTWVNLGHIVAAPDGSVTIEDADAPDFQARYYRVVNP